MVGFRPRCGSAAIRCWPGSADDETRGPGPTRCETARWVKGPSRAPEAWAPRRPRLVFRMAYLADSRLAGREGPRVAEGVLAGPAEAHHVARLGQPGVGRRDDRFDCPHLERVVLPRTDDCLDDLAHDVADDHS